MDFIRRDAHLARSPMNPPMGLTDANFLRFLIDFMANSYYSIGSFSMKHRLTTVIPFGLALIACEGAIPAESHS